MSQGSYGENLQNQSWKCPNCETLNDGEICVICGTPKPVRQDNTWTCSNCGSKNPEGASFCYNCGKPRDAVTDPPSPKIGVIVAVGIVAAVLLIVFLMMPKRRSAAQIIQAPVTYTTPSTTQATTQPAANGNYYEYVGGHWDDNTTALGDANVYLYILDMPLNNCTAFTMYVNVTMKAGTHCDTWVIWARTDGVLTNIGEFNLPGGDGDASVAVEFGQATSFDAIVITPTVPGGYSWDLGLGIGEVYLQ